MLLLIIIEPIFACLFALIPIVGPSKLSNGLSMQLVEVAAVVGLVFIVDRTRALDVVSSKELNEAVMAFVVDTLRESDG